MIELVVAFITRAGTIMKSPFVFLSPSISSKFHSFGHNYRLANPFPNNLRALRMCEILGTNKCELQLLTVFIPLKMALCAHDFAD
jgi:hypothetical protein